MTSSDFSPLDEPSHLGRRVEQLNLERELRVRRSQELAVEFAELNYYLELAPRVGQQLNELAKNLFNQLLDVVTSKLTLALQEILDQPITLKTTVEQSHKAASVEFYIERNGQKEDIMDGQGGSVANILSVGLRMFALATQDPARHRPFLVLDEQDCWLRPDLVPGLVKMIRDAGKALGFQVLMISHHDISVFERYADRIYQLQPKGENGVEVRLHNASPAVVDQL
ncbi:MAG: DNA repair protein [Pirellulales bacterium]|nr:DNA repair protein [Pirellulales bacterium]